jgi:hypothetical protein
MALVLTIGMVACGAPATDASEVKTDSTSVVADTTATAPVADTATAVK